MTGAHVDPPATPPRQAPPMWRRIMGRAQAVFILALLLVGVLMPLAPAYYLFVATVALLNVGASYGLMFPLKAGNVSVASAGFIAIGAYTTAVLRLQLQMNLAVALICSVVAAAVAALILSALLARARGAYFVMVTFAFTVLVGHVLNSDIPALGGPGGLYGFAGNTQLGLEPLGKTAIYYLVLAVTAGAGLILFLAQRSPLEDVWASMRNQEQLAASLGISVRPYAILAFVFGAMVQGAVGCMWAMFYGAIDPTAFTFWLSVAILVYCIVGGSSSSIVGVTVAAIALSILPEALADTPSLYQTAYGLLVAAVMLAQVLRFRQRIGAFLHKINPFGQQEPHDAPPEAADPVAEDVLRPAVPSNAWRGVGSGD